MGFIKEVYANGDAGLVVNFLQEETTENFFAGDSVEEAMKHFKLFLDANNRLRIDSESERAMDELAIEASQVKDFRDKITELIVNLDNDAAIENVILFPQWKSGVNYKTDERIRYNNALYIILQDHTSQDDWYPNVANSLYARVLRSWEENVIPTWEQPDSTNGFMTGDQVYHNGLLYVSTTDNNIWEPGSSSLWELVDSNTSEENKEYISGTIYNTNDIVIFEEKTYKSLIDNNSWSPADYPAGWEEII